VAVRFSGVPTASRHLRELKQDRRRIERLTPRPLPVAITRVDRLDAILVGNSRLGFGLRRPDGHRKPPSPRNGPRQSYYSGLPGPCALMVSVEMRKQAVSEDVQAEPAHPSLTHELGLPLVIDLDGTLISTDALHESLLIFLKRQASEAWKIPFWIFSGRAVVKRRLAEVVTDQDAETFPVNDDLVGVARREAGRGRRIVLATAADVSIAEKIQRRFSFIDQIIASTGGRNLKGAAKAEEVSARFPGGFIYAGDSAADLHVWSKATAAIFVGHSASMEGKIAARTSVAAVLPTKLLDFPTLRRSLRLHQWAKNALVFVPLVLGGKAGDPMAWLHALGGFVALSLLASATYLLNDLWDLTEDRRHWTKKNRPLASGDLSIAVAILMMTFGGLVAFGLAALIGTGCFLTLAIYLVVSLAYSFRLKREPIVDVFVLASMFTMRLALGLVVANVVFSPWLFVFSMFIFLSLSAAKRQTEIIRMVSHGLTDVPGRGYRAGDAPLVLALGVGAMLATVLIMVIYLVQDAFPQNFYKHPYFLWGFPMIILLWLARIWLLCNRGELNDDPVAFALKDRLSVAYGAVMALLFAAALI
jgi:4-hydroxybenzoate polyprenyltransferase